MLSLCTMSCFASDVSSENLTDGAQNRESYVRFDEDNLTLPSGPALVCTIFVPKIRDASENRVRLVMPDDVAKRNFESDKKSIGRDARIELNGKSYPARTVRLGRPKFTLNGYPFVLAPVGLIRKTILRDIGPRMKKRFSDDDRLIFNQMTVIENEEKMARVEWVVVSVKEAWRVKIDVTQAL